VATVTRHDAALAAIALAMSLACVLGVSTALALSTALAAGSLPAGGVVGYALFVATPGREE